MKKLSIPSRSTFCLRLVGQIPDCAIIGSRAVQVEYHRFALVRLNGVLLTDGVVSADEEAGTVTALIDDGRGGWRQINGVCQEQTLRGAVEISLQPDAPKSAQAQYWLDRLGWSWTGMVSP